MFRLVGRVDASGTRLYQFDPQGNVSHTTDAGGSLIDSRAYDAYGRELAVRNAAGVAVAANDPFGHDAKWGYYLDREVGWYHTDNRTYDPPTARWLERDPIGLAGGRALERFFANECAKQDTESLAYGR